MLYLAILLVSTAYYDKILYFFISQVYILDFFISLYGVYDKVNTLYSVYKSFKYGGDNVPYTGCLMYRLNSYGKYDNAVFGFL